jgi:hypothetical protein
MRKKTNKQKTTTTNNKKQQPNTKLPQNILPSMTLVKFKIFNPFPADVANKRHLDSAPKSHFCDLTGKTEVIGLPGLMTLFIDLGCLYCKQTQSIKCFQKHTKLIENRFSRTIVIQNSID